MVVCARLVVEQSNLSSFFIVQLAEAFRLVVAWMMKFSPSDSILSKSSHTIYVFVVGLSFDGYIAEIRNFPILKS